ncbi:MAG: ketopantoate reductase family protein [Candidatus Heimdallarchaeaceae archaeon]
MKAALIGLGAIGTIIAADLAKNDFSLYVVCKHQETLEIVKKRGLKVSGVSGEYIVKQNIKPVLKIEDLPERLDLVFLVTKLMDIDDAINRTLKKLDKDYTIVMMTNGMIEEEVENIISGENLVGCVVSFGATRKGLAESVKTSSGEMFLGRIQGEKKPIDEMLVKLLSNTVLTKYTNHIYNEKYSKLLINVAINSLGVISGMTLGKMLERKLTRIAFLTVISEGIKVAKAKGITLQKLNNLNLNFLEIKREELIKFSFKHFIKQTLIKIIGKKYKNLKSSSLQSFERDGRTEVDYLNGYIMKEGEKYGIKTPLNKYVVDEIHLMEKGDKKPSLEELVRLEQKVKEIWAIK